MAKKMTPMLEQYFSIKEQHKDAVLFFHMGDFYEMFGEDALEAAKILDLTLTARGKGTDNEIPMCGVPIHASSSYLSRLTQAGKKVAICDQVSEPDGKGIVKREVTKIVTPGTTFDESILNNKESNYLSCVVEDGEEYAFGLTDVTTGEFRVGLCESLQSLKDCVFRFNPSEILVSGSDKVRTLFESSVYVSDFELPSWHQPEKIITEHFQTSGLEGLGLAQSEPMTKAAATLLSYLQETQKSALGHIVSIQRHQSNNHMLLDESTVRNLDLFINQQTSSADGSLIQTIDRTKTSMGARLLRSWLAHPLTDSGAIIQRHEAVNLFYGSSDLRQNAADLLGAMCDIGRLVGKVGTQRVNPRDLYNLKEAIKLIPDIKELLQPHLNLHLMKDINSRLAESKNLVAEIERVLIYEPPVLMQDGGFIASDVSAELDELRNIARSGKDWINNLQEKERQRTGINSLKVKFNKVFGYYIEVSKANLDAVPDDYIRKQTLVNAERFITPGLKEYEEKILGAEDKIINLEMELFAKLRDFAFGFVEDLQSASNALAELDVLSSLAELAQTSNYVRPQLVEGALLEISQGRHAVIEGMQSEPYIANDLSMNEDSRFVLLTGPNMSGKSSYLRQNALIVLLAQIGSFVPAESMRWSVVDRVFTRVGASDNLAQGRSTFMVEMQEAAYILNNATEKSLVILDELGRGTSTYDGLSLAWAITEHLHDILKSKTLFATHYHELIEIVDGLSCAKNFCVAVAEEGDGVVFLHQVLQGGINRSYGIEVGKLAGLPQSLIIRAKDLLAKLEQHSFEKGQAKGQANLPLMPVSKQAEHPVVEKLKEIDPNNLTPLQALELISLLKQEFE